ncbi:MAG: AraC family transcriptional regulator [Beijerinckiaceae bacterium]
MDTTFVHRTWAIGSASGRGRFHAFLVTRGAALFHAEDETALELTGPVVLWLPRAVNGEFRLMAGGEGFAFSVAEDFVWRTVGDSPVALHLRPLFDRTIVAAAERITPRLAEVRISFEALVRETHDQQPGASAIAGAHLTLLLLHLWRAADLTEAAAGLRGTASATAQRFRQLVELHYRENLRIDEYARKLGVTRALLHDACLRATERTPLALIHDRLIAEAQSRLEQTELPVEQVGYSLGFRDPSYFNRFFKKQTGRTPAAFRQEHVAARPRSEAAASFAAWP